MIKQKAQEKGMGKMSEIDDQILKIFDIKKRLGKGAYGIVWKAMDKKTQQIVAVKKIFDAFRNETDAQRTFREIMFLRAFRNHENIIQLHSIHRAANHMDIYLSFEFMESDLHNVIKRGSILKDVHKRYVMYQLLNATKYIHSGNVIHRDLKPSNVLIDSRCRCKVADFGLARSVLPHDDDQDQVANEQVLTDYVATRWYRAPEILVASKNYTKGIDMWSLGCILAEMIRGKPLFPGSCTVNQVERIVSALPEVTESDIRSVGAGFGSALLNQNCSATNIKLDDLLSSSSDDARDLVRHLLVMDPTHRFTAKSAMEHKYVEKFRHVLPEPELSSDIVPPFRDDVQLSVQEYRSKLYELISSAEKNNFNGKSMGGGGGGSTLTNLAKRREHLSKSDSHCNKSKHKAESSIDDHLTISSRAGGTSSISSVASNNTHNKSTSDIKKCDKKGVNGLYASRSMVSNAASTASKLANKNTKNTTIDTDKSRMPKITRQSNGSFSVLDTQKSQAVNNSNLKCNISDYKLARRSSLDSAATSGYYSFDKKSRGDSRATLAKYSDSTDKIKSVSGESNYFTSANKPKAERAPLKHCRHSSLDIDEHSIYNHNQYQQSKQRHSVSDDKLLNHTPPNEFGSQIFYENRLKSLEDKIKKHQTDIKSFLHQKTRVKAKLEKSSKASKVSSETAVMGTRGGHNRGELTRSISEYNHITAPMKCDYSQADGDRSRYKPNRRGNNYGVIAASDLLRLRSTEIIL